MRLLEPAILKLDFAYGMPPPDVAAPRDPAMRGERCGEALMKIVVEAAREINPQVTIQYYGITPLMKSLVDMLALDDVGDCAESESDGHSEWSIWASLAGLEGYAIMASSGYDWHQDADIVMNTAIIGGSGCVLPMHIPDGSAVPERYICRRLAISRWQRRTRGWAPLWLNTESGTHGARPRVRNWGRLEKWQGETRLVALILKDGDGPGVDLGDGSHVRWSGCWALISQDEQSIFATSQLALIPFDAGWLELPRNAEPAEIRIISRTGETPLRTWKWKEAHLRIDLPDLTEGLVGLLVV
jgi:hypothetical protein